MILVYYIINAYVFCNFFWDFLGPFLYFRHSLCRRWGTVASQNAGRRYRIGPYLWCRGHVCSEQRVFLFNFNKIKFCIRLHQLPKSWEPSILDMVSFIDWKKFREFLSYWIKFKFSFFQTEGKRKLLRKNGLKNNKNQSSSVPLICGEALRVHQWMQGKTKIN